MQDWLVNSVLYNYVCIPYYSAVRNLEVYFDQTLSWSAHISKRTFLALKSLRRLRSFLPIRTKIMLANSLSYWKDKFQATAAPENAVCSSRNFMLGIPIKRKYMISLLLSKRLNCGTIYLQISVTQNHYFRLKRLLNIIFFNWWFILEFLYVEMDGLTINGDFSLVYDTKNIRC